MPKTKRLSVFAGPNGSGKVDKAYIFDNSSSDMLLFAEVVSGRIEILLLNTQY